MYPFDEKMLSYCKERKLIYSRYADDIYISSVSCIDKSVARDIPSEINKLGFKTNKEKTWFSSKKSRQRVTGLIITTDCRVSVGSEVRCIIKKMVYERVIHGRGDSEVLLGYLSYLKSIEPQTYNQLITKYSAYCDGDIIEAIERMERLQ